MVVPFPRLILPLAGLVVLAFPGRAGSNLLDNSPFLPPNSLTGGATEAAPLELRSILKAGGSYQFSLFDTSNRQSIWVGLNEPGHDFVVKGFEAGNNAITVEQRGRTYKLTLKEAKIALLATVPTPAPGAVPGAPGGPNAAFPPPGVAVGPRGPVPALTPEQLRNLEADINRRRELRRRAMAAPGMPTPVPAGQPR